MSSPLDRLDELRGRIRQADAVLVTVGALDQARAVRDLADHADGLARIARAAEGLAPWLPTPGFGRRHSPEEATAVLALREALAGLGANSEDAA